MNGKGRVCVVNTSTKVLYMSLILLVAATIFTGCASRAEGRAIVAASLHSPLKLLLAVDNPLVDRRQGDRPGHPHPGGWTGPESSGAAGTP
jgi:hypothetical protein